MTDDTYRPTVRNQRDLEAVWRVLMGDLGFTRRTLWLMLIEGDDRALAVLTQLDDVPRHLDDAGRAAMTSLFRHLGDASGSGERWAFLLSRPGRGGTTAEDRVWIRGLLEACRAAGLPHEVVHLATDDELVPVPLDDLGQRAG